MSQRPVVILVADNKKLDEPIMRRVMSVTVTDNKALEADELAIQLDDHDGALELPRRGVKLQCFMGYEGKALNDMGVFSVVDSEWSGSPDVINVTAKSADFKGSLKSGRSQSYHNETLGNIASQVAQRQELELVIADSLAKISTGHIDQTDESDINLLTRICRRYGATVTIKKGKLLIYLASSGKTASGKPLEPVTLTRRDGDRYRFKVADRDADVTGVKASYQDKAKASKQTVTAGGAGKTHQLKGNYKSKADAEAAANASLDRIKKKQATFSMTTSLGIPELSTEISAKLAGFKPSIDALSWTVDKCVHTYTKGGGISSQIDFTAPLV